METHWGVSAHPFFAETRCERMMSLPHHQPRRFRMNFHKSAKLACTIVPLHWHATRRAKKHDLCLPVGPSASTRPPHSQRPPARTWPPTPTALTELHPDHHKAWVSWAQLEKRIAQEERFAKCRDVLQRGLTLNPNSVFLIQAWGLMELQRGNFFAAVMLLERCAQADPVRCSPVLKWKPVRDAQRSVSGRLRSRRRIGGAA